MGFPLSTTRKAGAESEVLAAEADGFFEPADSAAKSDNIDDGSIHIHLAHFTAATALNKQNASADKTLVVDFTVAVAT